MNNMIKFFLITIAWLVFHVTFAMLSPLIVDNNYLLYVYADDDDNDNDDNDNDDNDNDDNDNDDNDNDDNDNDDNDNDDRDNDDSYSSESGGSNRESGGSNRESGGSNRESGGGNRESGGGNRESGGGNRESGGGNRESGGGNRESGGSNRESGGSNRESGGSNRESGGSNRESGSSNRENNYQQQTVEKGNSGNGFSSFFSREVAPQNFIDHDLPSHRQNIILAAYDSCQTMVFNQDKQLRLISSDCLSGVDIRLVEYQLLDISLTTGQKRLKGQKNLLWTQADYYYQSAGNVDNTHYALKMTGLSQTPNRLQGEGINIGLIDTLVDTKHKALKQANITQDNIFNLRKTDKHATAISGILVGTGKLRGIAPKAKLISIPAFDVDDREQRISHSSLLAKALSVMSEHDIDILNLSFVGPKERLIEKLVAGHLKSGTLVVAAGGNGSGNSKQIYPAAYRSVTGVSAVDAQKKLYSYATTGSHIDFAAPGVDILAAAPKNRYGFVSGSSFAAAYVTGLKALLIEHQQDKKHVLKLAIRHAEDLGASGKDKHFGHGLIQTPWVVLGQ